MPRTQRRTSRLPAPPRPRDRREPECWLPWIEEAFRSTPSRAWHSRGVWHLVASARLLELRHLERSRFEPLVLASLLHDIGRAVDPDDTEPHGFVGARFLEDLGLTDVAPLVAHHSGTRFEAEARGFAHADRWAGVDRDLLAVLTYADRTTGPSGERMTLAERRAELVARYGARSPQVERFDLVQPEALHGRRLLGRSERQATRTGAAAH